MASTGITTTGAATTVTSTPSSTTTTTTTAQPPANNFASIGFLVVFVLIFYFLLMRPQQKRAKEHKKLMSELTKGDEVLTNGGLVGKIQKVNDDFVVLNIAENVDITLQRSAVMATLPKGTLKSIEK